MTRWNVRWLLVGFLVILFSLGVPRRCGLREEDAEKKFGPESAVVAASVEQLADLYVDQGKEEQAEPLYRQAVALWEKNQGPEYPYVTRMLFRLAEICRRHGRAAEAESFYQLVISFYDEHTVINDRVLPKVLENYAALLRDEGRNVEATEVKRRAKGLKAKEPQNPFI